MYTDCQAVRENIMRKKEFEKLIVIRVTKDMWDDIKSIEDKNKRLSKAEVCRKLLQKGIDNNIF